MGYFLNYVVKQSFNKSFLRLDRIIKKHKMDKKRMGYR